MTETQPLRALPGRGRDARRSGGPRRRKSGTALRWLLSAVLLAVAGTIAAWQLAPGGDAQGAATFLTEEARTGDLEDRVEATATVAWPDDATADLRATGGGTVTAVAVREGARPGPLATVVEVGESPLVALASPLPLYRDLSEGLEGPDVQALEEALQATGHDPGPVDATFDASTTTAVQNWEAATGLEETGVMPLSRVAWLPPGGQVTAVLVRPGDPVAPGTPVASVARPDGLVVEAALDQADVARVPIGAPVDVELDALDGLLAATVDTVAVTPDEDGTYRATLRPATLPDGLRAGLRGTARVLVGVRDDVVVVPSGAVAGTSSAPTVRVLVNGQPETRTVRLGLVTTGGAEILEGVAPGDAVVVGERG